MKITETDSNLPRTTPVKEVMEIFIPSINENLPRRNGMVWTLCGGAGSGKSSLLMNLFRDKTLYKKKFNKIYYFTPEGSFSSTKNHPFAKHVSVFHQLEPDIIEDIQDECIANKQECIEEDYEQEYNCVILDDMVDRLKDKDMVRCLRRHLIKSRHANCAWIIITQSWNAIPLLLRKLIFYTTMFKPRNYQEADLLRREVIGMNEKDCNTLFDYVFDEPYNYLTIDNVLGKYSKNFNPLIIEK
jgi:hypothetical protein